MELFRQYGYDGVSLTKISEATGLGKSSLYHHFPEGKEQMAKEVLTFIAGAVKQYFVCPLQTSEKPRVKLQNMVKVVEDFYDSGKKGCLVDGLTLGEANPLFQSTIAEIVEAWIDAIAEVGVESGLSKKIARERAENIMIAIQGSLVVSRALGYFTPFKRVVRDIPSMMLDQ